MNGLKILDVYNKSNEDKIKDFNENLESTLSVTNDYEHVSTDTEWLDIMEDTIRYLDNILRNPNRFIINEEDIVKIELARRVTVESIKHLARNTNLIQDYDKETGDVKPSKILNINKEESFNTYENRFIYSLIQNMKGFIARKKSDGIVDAATKSNKVFDYTGAVKLGNEDVDISMQLNSKMDSSGGQNKGESLASRIEKLELQITDLTNSEVYKTIHKLHIALVTSPIKKTNVILKNVNFQYAVKLWNYMQEHIDSSNVNEKRNDRYDDTGELKDYVDETFLLNYLVMNELNKDEDGEEEKKEKLSEQVIGNMVEQVLKLNSEISLNDLNNIVGKQFEVLKYKQVTTTKKIEEIFNKKLNEYFMKIDSFNW